MSVKQKIKRSFRKIYQFLVSSETGDIVPNPIQTEIEHKEAYFRFSSHNKQVMNLRKSDALIQTTTG